ncbi:HYC_CC_PP family protein [Paraflavitalea pollutisoli]|uniref:HYC_CC_PP family protein n=1 Tax=Paraflavitalea pollutisoli TaxID=3034143 RepID=UPI003B834F0A
MKKVCLILLLTIYTVATLGISIRQFYCCGKLKSTSLVLSDNAPKKCAKGGEKDGCCKTKYQSIKVKDSHFVSDEITTPAKHFTEASSPGFSIDIPPLLIAAEFNANTPHAPPPDQLIALFILHCVYRI